jgi:hypothetical protein
MDYFFQDNHPESLLLISAREMSVWHVDRHCGYPEDFYSSRLYYVKVGHQLFLPHPLQFIINCHQIARRDVFRVTDSVVK